MSDIEQLKNELKEIGRKVATRRLDNGRVRLYATTQSRRIAKFDFNKEGKLEK